MSLIVQKFGGTSVANIERLQNVADIVTSTYKAGNQVVVVVSAQGDTHSIGTRPQPYRDCCRISGHQQAG